MFDKVKLEPSAIATLAVWGKGNGHALQPLRKFHVAACELPDVDLPGIPRLTGKVVLVRRKDNGRIHSGMLSQNRPVSIRKGIPEAQRSILRPGHQVALRAKCRGPDTVGVSRKAATAMPSVVSSAWRAHSLAT
jgi:hypothetical protein